MEDAEILLYTFWGLRCIITIALFYLSFKILFMLYTFSPLYRDHLPFVPTRMVFVRKALQLLDIRKGDKVLDLGSGSGRFLKYAARRVDASFLGIELNRFLYLCSKVNMFLVRIKGKVEIIHGSYDNEEWYDYDKVFMFSLPVEIERILPRLEKELKPGTLVASVIFPISSKKFKEKDKLCVDTLGGKKECLFLYERVD